ncbi:hypothetical protein B0H16DRAFT_1879540 [Mycena metata]|uniref:DUF726-domain-containing protein n=1 Tax=Mycena metata TaxID=1033252 RepID=A0AAD7K356_9AGAR|nr:hypothetical protein B0H16DRAFT_1879540 [Mycena metata]
MNSYSAGTGYAKGASAVNTTGNLIDFDDGGYEWRSKIDQNESDYTRLRGNEEDETDEMQTTKNLLTEAQRIAYVVAVQNMDLWATNIMGRLYYHMELETQALPSGCGPRPRSHDPVEARRQADEVFDYSASEFPVTPTPGYLPDASKVLAQTSAAAIPGVSTTLSAAGERVTLLCDLFLILIAGSAYDARSRVLLEQAALKLGLGWLGVVRFESRVTEVLEIQEDVEKMEQQELIHGRQKSARKKRYMMFGLATLGGGLVIGLSAGLLAPIIGAGLGATFSTIGITGTTGFLAGAGGAAVITTGGVLTGSIFRFMTGKLDDVPLPFSVLDPVVGDVFSVLWEPEMIQETGSALKALMASALQCPIILTNLGYIVDNPWNNALDRAKAAGSVLATSSCSDTSAFAPSRSSGSPSALAGWGLAGLGPVENVENVDVTDKIARHMGYRTFMPLILDQLGFSVFSDCPMEPDFEGDRLVGREEDKNKTKGWFSSKKEPARPQSVSTSHYEQLLEAQPSSSMISHHELVPARCWCIHTYPFLAHRQRPLRRGQKDPSTRWAELNPEELKPTNRSESAAPHQHTPPAADDDRPPFSPPSPSHS